MLIFNAKQDYLKSGSLLSLVSLKYGLLGFILNLKSISKMIITMIYRPDISHSEFFPKIYIT